jgi:DNA-binding MarR family transcriptional regulator
MKPSEKLLSSCVCTQMRTSSRLVTRVYDAFLRDTGLKASQLSVLAAIDSSHTVSIAELSKRLFMDRTTLSRNLKPLLAAQLVELGEEGWRRSKFVRITTAGQQRLAAAIPLWERAQDDILGRFGQKRWHTVSAHLNDLIAHY